MKLVELFVIESTGFNYDLIQEFIIRSWGKLLYLDYLLLPKGSDMSDAEEFVELAEEFLYLTHKKDEDALVELDEWISEGAPMKDGRYLLSRTTVDAVLASCQHAAGTGMILYRFDHTPSTLQPNSWISLTKNPSGYSGKRTEHHLSKTSKIIDTRGLADEGEVIISTNELIKTAD